MKELFQVNVNVNVENKKKYYMSQYSSNGYCGITINTRYADGVDMTFWCVFVGTRQACESFIQNDGFSLD